MSGQDQIRSVLQQRRNKLLTISESVDVGPQALDSFARGEAALSPDVLKALARHLLGGDYDDANDRIFLTSSPYAGARTNP